MSASIGLHGVISANVIRKENGGTYWLELTVKTDDGGECTITMFYRTVEPLEITGDVAVVEERF